MKTATIACLAAVAAIALIGCSAVKVANNKVVQMHYQGTLADGTVFDSSEGREPLEFLVGSSTIIPGLEKAVVGLKVGDKKKVEIKASDAYGEYDPQAVQEVPKDRFPADLKLEKGMELSAQTASGPMVVRIAEIKERSVMVDFNHPLAGKDLTFDVEIVKIRDATKEELAGVGAAPR